MDKKIKVVILGGGSAGWLTAGILASTLKNDEYCPYDVTLIESDITPIIGVGEGTWPTMRSTLKRIGISETDFVRECNACFKQGAKFVSWAKNSKEDFYYHPLMLPEYFSETNGYNLWKQYRSQFPLSFSDFVCPQEAICENGLAPKSIRDAEFAGVANYAYHFDAGLFVELARKRCVNGLKVKHHVDHIKEINQDHLGNVSSVLTNSGKEIEGDFFVDCTGFNSLIIDKVYNTPFIDCNDVLFVDRAIAAQIPYDNPNDPIACHTISTAHKAGWIWDIGLSSRKGTGIVYSSSHLDEDEAIGILSNYTNVAKNDQKIKKIDIRSGHRSKFWVKNCVAIGLSAGFLEPLEASALVMIELGASMIAENISSDARINEINAKRYNERMTYKWERVIDFLKLHYCISKREDSDFWLENRSKESWPDSLKEILELWSSRTPTDSDFFSNNEVFPAASYQYVMYGMGMESINTISASKNTNFEPNAYFNIVQDLKKRCLNNLPKHRDLINKIKEYGLGTI